MGGLASREALLMGLNRSNWVHLGTNTEEERMSEQGCLADMRCVIRLVIRRGWKG